MRLLEEKKTFDDFLEENEKIGVKNIKAQANIFCPHLRQLSEFYYICNVNNEKNIDIHNTNSFVKKHVSPAELGTYCMEDYKNCLCYDNK